jgi:5'-nucleotidase
VRIVVTNDDGVHAPGLAALTRALAPWAAARGHEVVVIAPMVNHSGAGAAVGTVYERESVAYKAARIEGAEDVAAFGLDASPALSVIIAALGGFGPRPDLVVSGINLGVNVGRSVLHSGTVGATLTGAQLGLSGLAVSLRAGAEVEHWDTAALLAAAMLEPLAAAPARTVLNLNVPSVPLSELRGVRRGRISGAGLIKAAVAPGTGSTVDANGATQVAGLLGEEGEITLRLGAAVPKLGELDTRPDAERDPATAAGVWGDGHLPEDDAVLVARGYASLTPVLGVRADESDGASVVIDAALSAATMVTD